MLPYSNLPIYSLCWSKPYILWECGILFLYPHGPAMFSIKYMFFHSLNKHFLLSNGSSDGKASAYNVGDLGSIPGLGRSPGEGNGNPLQYSCLENPMDQGVSWATVHGVAKRWTRLSDFTQVITVLTTTIITEMAKLSFTEHLLSTQVKFMEYGSILSPLKFQNHYVLARRSWPSYLNFSVPLLLHL